MEPDPWQEDRDGLPGPDDLAEPDHHDRKTDLFHHHEAPERQPGGSQNPRLRDDEEGRHPERGEPL